MVMIGQLIGDVLKPPDIYPEVSLSPFGTLLLENSLATNQLSSD